MIVFGMGNMFFTKLKLSLFVSLIEKWVDHEYSVPYVMIYY